MIYGIISADMIPRRSASDRREDISLCGSDASPGGSICRAHDIILSVITEQAVDTDREQDKENRKDGAYFMEKFSRKQLIMIAAAAMIAAAVLGMSFYYMPANRIARQLELGYRYLENEQYEEAVVAFEKAIGIDAKQVPAYMGEAAAYAAMEDYPNAAAVLERGYGVTQDAELSDRLAEMCREAARYYYERGEYDTAEEFLGRIPEALRDDRYSALEQEIRTGRLTEEAAEAPEEEREEPENSAGPEDTETAAEEPEGSEEADIPEEGPLSDDYTYDLRDYADRLTEDLGGDLAGTLASLLYPENPGYTESDDGMMYVLGDYDMEVGASDNNDGCMVWLYRPIEGFRIYGIEPGMTESDAAAELERQGILPEGGYYMIPKTEGEFPNGYKYITLTTENGIVEEVRFWHYLGIDRGF